MTRWLHIIGVTEAGIAALPPEARARIDAAETVIGPERLIAQLSKGTQSHIVWSSPLSAMLEQVENARGSQTVILASGDPNWFGIGATLSRNLDPQEFALHPAPSSFQLAAARLNWPLQNCATISLHGRDVTTLHPHVLPGNRILALTSDAGTLTDLADLLTARGYPQSQLTALEDLGGTDERITNFAAADAARQTIGDFYVLAIDCIADPTAPLLPPVPGLPDDTFISDGQLTKRDVRAATLARLAPYPGALLWDVGAGSGSVAIEWMRAACNATAICFERDPKRCDMITQNLFALGTPKLKIVTGEAPACLADQPTPDAIFIGGDVANDALFETCHAALKPGGRLVANAVTIEGEQALHRRHKTHGGELVRIDVSVAEPIGSHTAMRPRMPVTQWLMVKGAS